MTGKGRQIQFFSEREHASCRRHDLLPPCLMGKQRWRARASNWNIRPGSDFTRARLALEFQHWNYLVNPKNTCWEILSISHTWQLFHNLTCHMLFDLFLPTSPFQMTTWNSILFESFARMMIVPSHQTESSLGVYNSSSPTSDEKESTILCISKDLIQIRG